MVAAAANFRHLATYFGISARRMAPLPSLLALTVGLNSREPLLEMVISSKGNANHVDLLANDRNWTFSSILQYIYREIRHDYNGASRVIA